ncbi:hypothetical protein LQZ19_18485 [Treponema primitia]|uniref:hypothetical protein n=1 Tax=Treponema primitia TaxID=88058 RepID=UPI00397F8CED
MNTIKTLDDGTPITDEVADKLVADVYAALDRGAYRAIPNPHGQRGGTKPRKLDASARSALQAALDAADV